MPDDDNPVDAKEQSTSIGRVIEIPDHWAKDIIRENPDPNIQLWTGGNDV